MFGSAVERGGVSSRYQQHNLGRESSIKYLRALVEKQEGFMPDPVYLTSVQKNDFITPHLRSKYIDWFFDENEKFGFDVETPAIAINFLERYLSVRKVNKQELHIAMYASFTLATRIHESVLVAMSGDRRSRATHDDIKMMEVDILHTLSWRVHPVTSYCIARNILALLPFCKDAFSHQRQEDVDMLLYAVMREYSCLQETPSTLAFAAVLAASKYSRLPTQSVWELINETGSSKLNKNVEENADEMLKLLTTFDEPEYEDHLGRNSDSPTGIDEFCFTAQQCAPHKMAQSSGCYNNSNSKKRIADTNSLSVVNAKRPKMEGYTSPFQSPVRNS